ncbi:MAG TPA: hypothetical protein EYM38_01605, partial [Dehalococcoidia bacterium]|nr:hypothetical protein [Dehalococcoidia bacterium]
GSGTPTDFASSATGSAGPGFVGRGSVGTGPVGAGSVAAGFVGAGSVAVGSSGVIFGVETGPEVDCGALVLPASVRLSPHAAISINIIAPTAIKVPSFAFMAYLLSSIFLVSQSMTKLVTILFPGPYKYLFWQYSNIIFINYFENRRKNFCIRIHFNSGIPTSVMIKKARSRLAAMGRDYGVEE